MTELEVIQPEEQLEGGDAAESAEGQALQDATHEPGAHIEQTQTFEQSEAVESALAEAMNTAEQAGSLPTPLPRPAEETMGVAWEEPGPGGGQTDLSPLPIPNPEPASEEPGPRGGGAEELGVNMEPIPSPERVGMEEEGPGDPGGDAAIDPEPIWDSSEDARGLSPGFDGQVAETPDPPDPNRGSHSENGGEVTPINLPAMPEDDNEATPINLP